MGITLRRMGVEEKALLVRLMELYSYEFSQFSQDEINDYGYYGYAHIDDYWNEEGRFPYLILVNRNIAGFALICPHCNYRKEADARCIGEFFVMLKYRRMGVGKQVAMRLFDKHPGKWEVCYWKNNIPASLFWKNVVEEYTKGHYQTCGTESSHEMGFTFENDASSGMVGEAASKDGHN